MKLNDDIYNNTTMKFKDDHNKIIPITASTVVDAAMGIQSNKGKLNVKLIRLYTGVFIE